MRVVKASLSSANQTLFEASSCPARCFIFESMDPRLRGDVFCRLAHLGQKRRLQKNLLYITLTPVIKALTDHHVRL